MEEKTFGQIAHAAYQDWVAPGRVIDFDNLPQIAKDGWEMAGKAVIAQLQLIERGPGTKVSNHKIEPKPEKINPGEGWTLLTHYCDSIKRGDEGLTPGGWASPPNELIGRIYRPGLPAFRRRKIQ